ncbi:MAG: glycosyltransferase [Myxococcota bacterium]
MAIPLPGHIHPLLLQAGELRRRGWEATVATHDEAMPFVERARTDGVRALSLGPLDGEPPAWADIEAQVTHEPDFLRSATVIVKWLQARWSRTFDGALQAIRTISPDVVVADVATQGALDAAESMRTPVVINNADLLGILSVELIRPGSDVPLFFSGKSIRALGALDRVVARPLRWLAARVANATLGKQLNAERSKRNLPPADVNTRLAGRTVLVNTTFGVEYPHNIPPHVHMVGPMLPSSVPALPDDVDRWLREGPPVVYASLGTVSRAGPALLDTLLDGFRSDAFRVLWALRTPEALRGPPPSNVRIMPWAPSPLAIMHHPNVRAVVSHCGINTAHEALAAGQPIVGIPLFADQLDMAMRVVDLGAGIRLDKTRLTSDGVREAISRAVADPSLRVPMEAVRRSFRDAGGVRRAADLIEHEAKRAPAPR